MNNLSTSVWLPRREGMRRGVKEVWGDGNVSEKSRGWVLVGPAIQGRKTHTQNKDKS